jgi:hypothetical protein
MDGLEFILGVSELLQQKRDIFQPKKYPKFFKRIEKLNGVLIPLIQIFSRIRLHRRPPVYMQPQDIASILFQVKLSRN